MSRSHITPGIAILFVLLSSSSEFTMVIEHRLAQFDGVVATRTNDIYYPPWTRNRANRYVIRESGGQEHVYHADSAEDSRDGFPIGTKLTKQRWHMEYEEMVRSGIISRSAYTSARWCLTLPCWWRA